MEVTAASSDTTLFLANAAKGHGNAAFGSKQYQRAITHYSEALQIFEEAGGTSGAYAGERSILYSNRAAASLALGQLPNYEDAARDCTYALQLHPSNGKAQYRKALAQEHLAVLSSKEELTQEAIASLEKLLLQEPKNAAVLVALKRMKDKHLLSPSSSALTSSELPNGDVDTFLSMLFTGETRTAMIDTRKAVGHLINHRNSKMHPRFFTWLVHALVSFTCQTLLADGSPVPAGVQVSPDAKWSGVTDVLVAVEAAKGLKVLLDPGQGSEGVLRDNMSVEADVQWMYTEALPILIRGIDITAALKSKARAQWAQLIPVLVPAVARMLLVNLKQSGECALSLLAALGTNVSAPGDSLSVPPPAFSFASRDYVAETLSFLVRSNREWVGAARAHALRPLLQHRRSAHIQFGRDYYMLALSSLLQSAVPETIGTPDSTPAPTKISSQVIPGAGEHKKQTDKGESEAHAEDSAAAEALQEDLFRLIVVPVVQGTAEAIIGALHALMLLAQVNAPMAIRLLQVKLPMSASTPSSVSASLDSSSSKSQISPSPAINGDERSILDLFIQVCSVTKDSNVRVHFAGVCAFACTDPIIRAAIVAEGTEHVFMDIVQTGWEKKAFASFEQIFLCSCSVLTVSKLLIECRKKAGASSGGGKASLHLFTREHYEVIAEVILNCLTACCTESTLDVHESTDCVQVATEALVYLSMDKLFKAVLFEKDRAATMLALLCSQVDKKAWTWNRSIGLAVAKMLRHVCTSATTIEDQEKQEDGGANIAHLRKTAQMHASKDVKETQQARDVILQLAGDEPTAVSLRRKMVTSLPVVKLLTLVLPKKETDSVSGSGGDSGGRGSGRLAQNKQADAVLNDAAFILLQLVSDPVNRGELNKQGVLKFLSETFKAKANDGGGSPAPPAEEGPDKEFARSLGCYYLSCLAIARVAISTNPHLVPSATVHALVTPLLYLTAHATHELHEFEAMMGLTNLCSLGPDLCGVIVHRGGWALLMEKVLMSENFQLQRAAMEALCNLCTCVASFTVLHKQLDGVHTNQTEDREADAKKKSAGRDLDIFLALAQSDDFATQNAAMGALAMLSSDKRIAKAIAESNMGAYQRLKSPTSVDEEKEGKEEKECKGSQPDSFLPSGYLLMQALMQHSEVREEVKKRAAFALSNMEEALRQQ